MISARRIRQENTKSMRFLTQLHHDKLLLMPKDMVKHPPTTWEQIKQPKVETTTTISQ